MQFKGALRSPGDRGPGVRVELVVDEFHLEILRDHELIGRWYLADVEVVRDIAERFVLFLDDEEMEFLADDALQFAYDGVTAMQNAWLRAQKKKRRHRKAAADAARRKDESPAPAKKKEELPVAEPVRPTRQTRPAASSELARRVAASTPTASTTTKVADSVTRIGPTKPEPEIAEQVGAGRQSLAARRKKIAAEASELPVAPVEATPSPRRRRQSAVAREVPVRDELGALSQVDGGGPGALSQVDGGGPGALSQVDEREPGAPPPWIAPAEHPDEVAIASTAHPTVTPNDLKEPDGVTQLAPDAAEVRTRRRSRVAPPTEAPEPVRPRGRGRRLTTDSNGASSPSVDDAPAQVGQETASEADVRFAAEGHHPAETNTGILSRLRRQPKKPDNHVHKFQESGSSVGLVRRVCVECSHVSIGSDDDSSSVTRW